MGILPSVLVDFFLSLNSQLQNHLLTIRKMHNVRSVSLSFIQRLCESYNLGNSLSIGLRELLCGSRGEALIYDLRLRNTCSQAYISVKGHC